MIDHAKAQLAFEYWKRCNDDDMEFLGPLEDKALEYAVAVLGAYFGEEVKAVTVDCVSEPPMEPELAPSVGWDFPNDGMFLGWIAERLEYVHGDKHNDGFMRRLRGIAAEMGAELRKASEPSMETAEERLIHGRRMAEKAKEPACEYRMIHYSGRIKRLQVGVRLGFGPVEGCRVVWWDKVPGDEKARMNIEYPAPDCDDKTPWQPSRQMAYNVAVAALAIDTKRHRAELRKAAGLEE